MKKWREHLSSARRRVEKLEERDDLATNDPLRAEIALAELEVQTALVMLLADAKIEIRSYSDDYLEIKEEMRNLYRAVSELRDTVVVLTRKLAQMTPGDPPAQRPWWKW